MRWLSAIAVVVIGLAACRISADEPANTTLVLTLPQISWSLEIAAPGLVLEQRELAPNGDAARLAASTKGKSRVIVTAFLEKAPKKGDSKVCRDFYWGRGKQSPIRKERITMRESGDMALLQYLAPEFNQQNLNAYLAEDGYWIDVHLSTTDDVAGKKDPFESIVRGIRINHAYSPTTLERFAFGNFFYRKKDYASAITHYEKALENEKGKATLDRTRWIVLVDNLGMSYGISGRVDKAERLYAWGIAKEPKYPMFYYNLACTCAEEDKLDDAIKNLRLAWKYHSDVLPGDSFPDPRSDSSFAKYLNNEQFRAELDKMK